MSTLKALKKKRGKIRGEMRFQVDYWLLLAVAGLVVIGMLMVYSTTFDYGLRFFDQSSYFLRRQLIALVIGAAGAIIFLQFDYHLLRRASVVVLLLTLATLLFVLLFSQAFFGARRGLYEGSFQPSEFAKLTVILYISHWLSSKGDRIKNLTYGLFPFAVITGSVCALIVLQPDLGTAGLIAMIALALFFVAGAELRQFAIAGLVGFLMFLVLITILPHAAERVDAYKIALKDPVQAGWHVQQSVVALGSGRFFGVGLGESAQKFGPLPAAHTDGVFAILGEELGLFGCLVVIGFLALFTWRGIKTAQQARDSYGFLLAAGITTWLALQALINMAVITAIIPFTGMPLPFLSYGGSSLAVSLLAVGILLSISRDSALNIKVQSSKPIRETLRENLSFRRRNRRTHISGAGHTS